MNIPETSRHKFSTAYTFVDIFAGCGGLSLGLMQAGWKGLFAIEHDSNAFETLYENLILPKTQFQFDWPEWLPKTASSVADILRDKQEELKSLSGDVDMLVGGPPCQGFSGAGKRNPNDPRNRLVEQYFEFVKILKPRVVLIENVRGMTFDFEADTVLGKKINYAQWILQTLSADYRVFSRMIDLSQFGVPQKRRRFFIIGFQKRVQNIPSDIFDIIEKDQYAFLRRKGISVVPVSARAAISDLEIRRNGKMPSRDSIGFDDIAYLGPLTNYQKIMNKGTAGIPPDTRLARHKPEVEARFKKIIDLCHADGRLNISLSSELKASLGLKKCAIRVLDPDSPSPTITSMPDDLIHYSEPRTLCVRENARLQGFPDWFAFKGRYTTGGERRRRQVPRFTQVANAVPPLVAEAFGLSIARLLLQSEMLQESSMEEFI